MVRGGEVDAGVGGDGDVVVVVERVDVRDGGGGRGRRDAAVGGEGEKAVHL